MRVYFYYSKNLRDCAMYVIGKGDYLYDVYNIKFDYLGKLEVEVNTKRILSLDLESKEFNVADKSFKITQMVVYKMLKK